MKTHGATYETAIERMNAHQKTYDAALERMAKENIRWNIGLWVSAVVIVVGAMGLFLNRNPAPVQLVLPPQLAAPQTVQPPAAAPSAAQPEPD